MTDSDSLLTTDTESFFSAHVGDGDSGELDSSTIRSISPATIRDNGSQGPEHRHQISVDDLAVRPRTDIVVEVFNMLSEIASLVTRSLPSALTDAESSRTIPYGDRNAVKPHNLHNHDLHRTIPPVFLFQEPMVKTVLLGTSESGKTTLLKGLRPLIGRDYTLEDRILWREVIFSNLVQSFRIVLESMGPLDLLLDTDRNERHAQVIFMQPSQIEVDYLDSEAITAVKALWLDQGFQRCYSWRRKYQLFENLEYFVHSIERLEQSDYVPSFEDILRTRDWTVGCRAVDFTLHGTNQLLIDNGGMRNQRKKWVHCFEGAHLAVFVADASAYDKFLFEDETVNRMEEQLVLFDGIVNSHWFARTRFLLVFSHMDLLEQRLSVSHPARYFPDFGLEEDQRPPSVDEYMAYIQHRFTSLIKSTMHQEAIRIVHADLVDWKAYESTAYELLQTT